MIRNQAVRYMSMFACVCVRNALCLQRLLVCAVDPVHNVLQASGLRPYECRMRKSARYLGVGGKREVKRGQLMAIYVTLYGASADLAQLRKYAPDARRMGHASLEQIFDRVELNRGRVSMIVLVDDVLQYNKTEVENMSEAQCASLPMWTDPVYQRMRSNGFAKYPNGVLTVITWKQAWQALPKMGMLLTKHDVRGNLQFTPVFLKDAAKEQVAQTRLRLSIQHELV